MAKRATITDLARSAGVSVATVDRVLNARARVRKETARKVYEAASAIGFHATPLIGQRLDEELPLLRIGVVLQKEKQYFYQAFKAEMEEAARNAHGVRCEVSFAFSPSQAPNDFVRLMDQLAESNDVITGTVVNNVETADAVQRIQARGIPVFALLNDFAQGSRASYLGMDNFKIGRTAAHMIATVMHRPGKVAVFVGGARWHGHLLRETGFRSYFREHSPQFTVLDTLINLETRLLTHEAMLDLMERHPDLRGVYCAGGGMEGAISALREIADPGQVALVVNELTPESRSALADRYLAMAIATPLAEVCRQFIAHAVALKQPNPALVPGHQFLQPTLYLPESV